MSNDNQAEMTFWDHLEVLRGCLFRILGATLLFSVLGFVFKHQLFAAVLAPCREGFITYKLLGAAPYNVELINTQLTEQFFVHMKMALMVGLLCASPYIIFVLYQFIAPALYDEEKRHSMPILLASYIMFMLGVAMNYLILYPVTLRFLTTYNVSPDVHSMLSLSSYTDTLLILSLVFGVVFEIPVISLLMARLGVLHSDFMKKYRKEAVIVILVLAAFITPTSDIFTLLIVSLPIYILFEISIFLVKGQERRKREKALREDE